ncbi:MEMBRANE-ASSOCIATED KINASE REGULATOR 4 [Hibiscus trionum]|uniref:MEMBRANE-ASSOCIATED KINASE REGULATOR 4 n=1 Tax=Hibiscus trionum TaxID=183268 RepID=A0A9W7I6Z1_HIBTR|nr:MEMBRANE-ASSOCIATED KINASE REGULATOR 4 [Hibiscus trionum]
MAVSLLLPNDLNVEDDEYIEMEVSSYSNFFCNTSISSPTPHFPTEFEFQMSSSSTEIEPTTSPADELFYKGKLRPLHLPPRLQMVETLLLNSTSVYQDFYTTPLTNTATTTPFESCNVSPSGSCRISQELNPEECSFVYSTEALSGRCNSQNHRKKSSSLSSKLKAYRAFLKSLFSISGCSSESCSAAKVADEGSVLRAKERLDRSTMMKSTKKAPFGQIRHRRSFSLAVKQQHSTNKSSSLSTSSSGSSSSPSSNGVQNLQFLKRSNSVNVEVESPIQGAIAHCKKSQLIRSKKTVSELNP